MSGAQIVHLPLQTRSLDMAGVPDLSSSTKEEPCRPSSLTCSGCRYQDQMSSVLSAQAFVLSYVPTLQLEGCLLFYVPLWFTTPQFGCLGFPFSASILKPGTFLGAIYGFLYPIVFLPRFVWALSHPGNAYGWEFEGFFFIILVLISFYTNLCYDIL